jgi:hypothetical protein
VNGTTNYVVKFASSSTVATGSIYDDGTNIGIGTSSPGQKLEVVTVSNTRIRINSTEVVATEYFRSGTGLWLVGSDSSNSFKIARASNFGTNDYLSINSATADVTFFDTALGARMTLNSTGLGIGTTSPTSPLTVQSNGTQLRLQTTNEPTTYFAKIGARYDASHPFTIEVANGAATATEYFGIYADIGGANTRIALLSGSVGIGTTSPAYKLDVIGPATSNGVTLRLSDAASLANSRHILLTRGSVSGSIGIAGSQTEDPLWLSRSSGYDLIVASSGNIGIGTSIPGALLEISSSTAASLLNVKGVGGNGLLFVSGSGNVGIGTSTPTQLLELRKTSASAIALLNYNDSVKLNLNASSGGAGYVGMVTNHPLIFVTNDTERVRIDTNGNIGIGTTSPASRLHVVGSEAYIRVTDSDDSGVFFIGNTSGFSYIRAFSRDFRFLNAAGVSLINIASDGNIGIGTTSPAYKLDVGGTARVGDTFLITTATTADARLEIGSGRSGNGNSYLDLIGDATYTDYGLRLIRYDTGANANSRLEHKGTGQLQLFAAEAASVTISTTSTERMRITADGIVGIGTSSPNSWAKLEVYGTTAVNGILYINENYKIQALTAFPGSAGKLILNGDGGNVGIGTTSAYSKLTISVPATNTISTADSSNTAGLTISGTGNLVRLQFGVGSSTLGPYGGWIQASYDNTGGNDGIEPLLLNPSGGSIGIGTSSPSQLVEAYKSANSDIVFKITNPNTGSIATAQYYASNGTTQSQFFHTGTNFSGAGVLNYAGLGGIYNSATGISLAATNASGVILFGTGTSATERMRIAADGNVGIGTTSPSEKLHIVSSGLTITKVKGGSSSNQGSAFYVEKAGSTSTLTAFGDEAAITGGTPDQNVSIWTAASTPLTFQIGGGERMRITSVGNVGIGTSSPTALLHVSSSSDEVQIGTIGNDQIVGGRTGGSFGIATKSASNGNLILTANAALYFRTSGSNDSMYISNTGNVGLGTTNPAAKLQIASTNNQSVIYTTGATTGFTYLQIQNSGGSNYFGMSDSNGVFWSTTPYTSYHATIGTAANIPLTFTTNNLIRMLLDNSGNLGIGTVTPATKLEVYGVVRITESASGGILQMQAGSSALDFASTFYGGTYRPFTFTNGGSERMRIQSDGNVGIGTSSPSQLLEVAGSSPIIRVLATSGNSTLRLTDNGVRNWDLKVVDTSDYFEVGGTNTTSLIVTGTGNVGIGDSAPSYKLDVSGSVRIYGSPSNGGLIFRGSSSTQGNIRPSVGNGTVLISDDSGGATRGMTVNNNGGITVSTANASQNIIEGQANGSQVMCLNYNGNIGLGTSSPIAKLDVRPATDGDAGISIGTGGSISGTIVSPANLFINANTGNAQSGAGQIAFGFQRTGFTGGSEVMRITEAGGGIVGIGTTSPGNSKLHIYADHISNHSILKIQTITSIASGGVPSLALFDADGSRNTLVYAASDGTYLANEVTKPIIFSTNSTEKMRITSGGNVGIGTTSPAAKLDVAGNSKLGSSISNVHQITGSLSITGSVSGINTESFHPFLLG